MVNILIIVVIILVFSFIMALIITGNDNHISEEERKEMVDDPKVLFDDNGNDLNKDHLLDKNTNMDSIISNHDKIDDSFDSVFDHRLPVDADNSHKEEILDDSSNDSYISIPTVDVDHISGGIEIDEEII